MPTAHARPQLSLVAPRDTRARGGVVRRPVRDAERAREHTVLVLHGPNMQLLGTREPDLYGPTTLAELDRELRASGKDLGLKLQIYQSNHEGEILDRIGGAAQRVDAIVINPAAFTHTSLAIRDAIAAVGIPTIEVHLTNTCARESRRRVSIVGEACLGRIEGFGPRSYLLALQVVASVLEDRDAAGS